MLRLKGYATLGGLIDWEGMDLFLSWTVRPIHHTLPFIARLIVHHKGSAIVL
jgi:hypothetical protein